MATTIKKKTKSTTPSSKAIVVSKKVRDYSNDPFFEKKAKEMESIIKKHGLPNSSLR